MALFNYECDEVKRIIEEVKPNYPQLTTYVSEWLYFHEQHYNPGTPVELEYETVSVKPVASVSNAIPFQYKSAILKGCTLLLDELGNECDIPNAPKMSLGAYISETTGKEIASDNVALTVYFIKCPTTSFRVKGDNKYKRIIFYDENKNFISGINCGLSNNAPYTVNTSKIPKGAVYLRISVSVNPKGVNYTPSKEIFIDDTKGNNLYLTELVSVQMPVLTTSNENGTETNILRVNEDITLRSNGDVYDELNLLTGHLTQRIDENNEVLAQEVIKTVALTPLNKPYEGTNHYELTSNIPCEAILEVPVVSTGKQTLEEINN